MDKIQRIKELAGANAETEIAQGLGLYKKGGKYRCPNGYAHKNGDRNPSMSWDRNALQFYCFTCGHKIDIYSYYREHLNYSHQEIISDLLGEQGRLRSSRETFTAEARKVGEINQECVDYLKLRKVNAETIKHFNLGTYKGQIAFPYYRYETLIGYKLRKPQAKIDGPKMTSITGSKPYLFNVQNIDVENKEIIICEGEIDCMVLHQAGFANSVSVGAGANSIKQLYEQAKDFLTRFDNIIIFSDNDDAGTEMDKAFTELLGDKVKIVDKKLYNLKDINEEYYKYGKSKIQEMVESARFKIEGRRDLDKEPYRGLTVENGKYIPTGIPDIDEAINDLEPKRVTLITGRSNGGKTTFVKQIMASAINKGNKVYLMNGENDPESLLNEFYQIVIGRNKEHYNTIKINRKFKKEPKPEVLKRLQYWHMGKLTLFNKGESKLKTIDQLLRMLEEEIKYNQHDLVIIDNMMSILSVKAAEKYEQQADFVQALTDLSKVYSTHIILVLHPNKTYQKGGNMDMEQISGSSDIYNKADNIIAVTREYDEDKIGNMINGYIQVIKNRYYPELTKVITWYDKDTGLLLQRDENGDIHQYSFNWDLTLKSDTRKEETPF